MGRKKKGMNEIRRIVFWLIESCMLEVMAWMVLEITFYHEKRFGGASNICAVKMVGLLFMFALFINFLRSDYNDIADANSWDKEREIKMKGLLPCAVFLQE